LLSIRSIVAAVLATAAFATPAAANVQVGSSGWQWGNPLPQGNTLRAASFAGTTGYAAGDFGTLLKTTDGGSTWSGLPVGSFQGLTVVQAVDANTVVAGGGCVARRSTDGGATFTAIAFTPIESSCRARLADMSFVNANLGFLLLDDGSVLTTTDGGVHFSPRTALPFTRAAGASADARSIVFTSPTTGLAATTGGQIFRTTDGGSSWATVRLGGGGINQVWFFDASHGFAVGSGGVLLRSDDGGQTWANTSIAVPDGPALSSIRCSTPVLCVISTVAGTELVRTADAGATPGTVITPSTDPIYAAAFASPTRIAALGANGATVVSDDAGQTFAPIGGRLAGLYFGIVAGGQHGTAFARGSGGALAKTTDGGKTWTKGNVPTSALLRDVSFPTAAAGFALDGDGGLFGTSDGGGSWKPLGTGSTAKPQAVYAPSASTVLVVGPRGLRRSTDAGQTFSAVSARAVARAQLSDVNAARGGAIFVWSATTVARSLDQGRTWAALVKPGANARARRRLRIAQVAFSSSAAGLLRDSHGQIWRTTNAGRSWSVLRGVGTERIQGMATSSAAGAYLVTDMFGVGGRGGYLLRTNDGGATWQPQFVVSTPIVSDGIAAQPGGTDYLLGGESGLLFSTTGGSAGARSTLALSTRSRSPRKAGSINVTGRLAPAAGGEQVTVSELPPGATVWAHKVVQVASNGSFVSGWRLRKGTTTFVAQWVGNFASAGTGSKVLAVTVGAARKPKPRRRR
jgi:photosystem II stability/assembly factor-like uncharacterized protein